MKVKKNKKTKLTNVKVDLTRSWDVKFLTKIFDTVKYKANREAWQEFRDELSMTCVLLNTLVHKIDLAEACIEHKQQVKKKKKGKKK